MCKAGVLVSILHLLRAFKVDMSGQELTTVPQTIDPTVDRLILSNNQLITLDVGSFKRYVNLLELNMNNCEIKFIYEGTFLMQVKLMKLFLKFNKIKYLPGDFGPSVSTLIDLQLYGGLFKKYQLKDPYFSTFNRLRTVVIGGEVIDVSSVTIPASLIKFQVANMALKIFPNFFPKLLFWKKWVCLETSFPLSPMSILRLLRALWWLLVFMKIIYKKCLLYRIWSILKTCGSVKMRLRSYPGTPLKGW